MWEKLAEASKIFWYGLFYLLDEDKRSPLGDGELIGIPLSDGYYLEMTKTTARITKSCITKTYIKRYSKDVFPYTKLLDWYIKEVIIGKAL
jgi:hypothetical protein